MFKGHGKVLAILAVSLAVLTFGAPLVTAAQGGGHYAMVVFLKGSEFFNWAFMGMRDCAKLLDPSITVELRGPSTWDASQEAQAIRELTAKGVDGILVTAGASHTLVPAINDAIAKGIPVIGFDSDPVFSNRLGKVTTDQFQAGYVAGKEVVKWLNGKGDIIVSTNPGIEYLVKRLDGFKAGIAGTDIKIVAEVNDEGKISTAETKITAALQAHPEVKAIFCAHGNPGIGAAAAVKNTGMTGKVDIMAFDFSRKVCEDIENGTIRATVGQNPYLMGWFGMLDLWSANQHTEVTSRHEPFGYVPPNIDTGVSILYKKDIGQYLNPPAFVTGGGE